MPETMSTNVVSGVVRSVGGRGAHLAILLGAILIGYHDLLI